jgi:ABC-type glycerol-3-phosphate transport system substrate-binding protein
MKKGILFFSLVLLAMSILIISCSGRNADVNMTKLRVLFWGDKKEYGIITDAIARFEKAYPNVKVILKKAPRDPAVFNIDPEETITPDVIFVTSDSVVALATKDSMLDLKPFIEKDKFPLNTYSGNDRFTHNGKIVAIPLDIAPVCCLYYNKKKFDAAKLSYPTDSMTWSDLEAIAKKLTKIDTIGQVTQFGICEDWNQWDAYILNNGGAYTDSTENPRKCVLDSRNVVYAIKFRQDLIYKDKVMPTPEQLSAICGDNNADMFISGKCAMFLSGIWKTPAFRKIKGFDWDIALFPKGPMAKHPGYLGGNSGFGILKTTKHPEESWKLVTYLVGTEAQKELAETGLAQPAIKSIAESSAFLDKKPPLNKKMLIEASQYIVYTPFMDEWQEILTRYIMPDMDRIWSNKENSIDEIMKEIVENVNETISNARKKAAENK